VVTAPVKDCWLCVSPPFWVSERNTSGTLVKPAASIWLAVITVTGAGPSICVRAMREPVTWMVCSSVGSGASGGVALLGGGGAGRGACRTG
jgi:hypothetical protein